MNRKCACLVGNVHRMRFEFVYMKRLRKIVKKILSRVRGSVTNNNGSSVGFIGAAITITLNYNHNSPQSVTA
jgi:hypothetical protein